MLKRSESALAGMFVVGLASCSSPSGGASRAVTAEKPAARVCGRGNVAPRLVIRREDRARGVRVGFIDATGKVVIAPRFDEALGFTEGLAAVRTETGWGFIDETGELVIPARYRHVQSFSEGLAVVVLEEKSELWPDSTSAFPVQRCAYIDCHGETRLAPTWMHRCGSFHDGRALVWPYTNPPNAGSGARFIDPSGQVAFGDVFIGTRMTHTTPLGTPGGTAFVEAGDFQEGFVLLPTAAAGEAPSQALFDVHGAKLEVPEGWTVVGPMSDGLARVMRNDGRETVKTGFVDPSGKLVFTLDGYAGDFHEGRAIVEDAPRGISRYIDRTGAIAMTGFQSASDFEDGHAFVALGSGARVIIDRDGKVLREHTQNGRWAGHGLIHVAAVPEVGPNDEGYMNLEGKYVYLTPRALGMLGDAWVREHYVGPPRRDPRYPW